MAEVRVRYLRQEQARTQAGDTARRCRALMLRHCRRMPAARLFAITVESRRRPLTIRPLQESRGANTGAARDGRR